jgi:hypothetical protein
VQPNTPDQSRPIPNVAFRVHTVSAFRDKRSAGAVATTDSALIGADYDNAAVALYGASRYERNDERVAYRVASGAFREISYPKQWLLPQRSYSRDSSRIAPISVLRSAEQNLAVAVRLALGSEKFSMWGRGTCVAWAAYQRES